MPPLKLEIYSDTTQNWHEVGQLNPGDTYGSISDYSSGHREIFFFGIEGNSQQAFIKKSIFGQDTESGNMRAIHLLGGTSTVASLDPGQVYELTVVTAVSSGPRHLRFTNL